MVKDENPYHCFLIAISVLFLIAISVCMCMLSLVHGVLETQRTVDKYASDITDNFPTQLISQRSCLWNVIAKCTTVKDLAHLLLIENAALSASFPNVCTVVILFPTIPVTVATAERSFSKLRLIKNYFKNTMGQERLIGLSVLSIEHEEARYLQKTFKG